MRLAILFNNIGGYHAARIFATHKACLARGWELIAIQVTDNTREHPWGQFTSDIPFELHTLLPSISPLDIERGQGAAKAAKLLSKLLSDITPEIVAIPGWATPTSQSALLWAKKHKAKTILMSESKKDDDKRTWWKELVKSKFYVSKYSAALVGGNLHREYLAELGLPNERIYFGYDAVDNDYFFLQGKIAQVEAARIRKTYPNIPKEPYFLCVTRLIERKNVLRLIEAFAAYRLTITDNNAWSLVICGSGDQEVAIRHKVQKLDLVDYVYFPGFVTYQDIGYWYGLASAFVHPALREQWGLVINEACATGLPILCSRTVGACYDLVEEGQNGFTFDPESSEDISHSLVKMHRLEEPRRVAFGKHSQHLVSQYSPQQFAVGLLTAADAALLEGR